MRLLFLLPDFPYPPSTGGRAKVFNELLFISERHHCDLLCIANPTDEQRTGMQKALPNVNILHAFPGPSFWIKALGGIWNVIRLQPPSLAAFTDKRFTVEVAAALSSTSYDVIHYDIINMAQYLPLGKGISSVHSPNDATSLAYSKLAEQVPWSAKKLRLWISTWLLRRYEYKVYPGFTRVHVVSEVDAEYLRKVNPRIHVKVIPIALDLHAISERTAEKKSVGAKIICTGNFANPAISKGAEDFISEAFPVILDTLPHAKLIILGKNAGEDLRKKADSKNIEYIDWVEDYNAFLRQADIILAPDYAAAPGAKTRVLQAMGLEIPVVGTGPAFEGIPIINGEHGVVYKSMPECAILMLELLRDRGRRLSLGKNGRELVAANFSLDAIGPEYEKLYTCAMER